MLQRIAINRAKRGASTDETEEEEGEEDVFWKRFWEAPRDGDTDDELEYSADDECESDEEEHASALYKEYSVDDEYEQSEEEHSPYKTYGPPIPSYTPERRSDDDIYYTWPFAPSSFQYTPYSPSYSPTSDRDPPSPCYLPLRHSDPPSPCYSSHGDVDTPSPCYSPLVNDVFIYDCESPPPAEDRKRKHDEEDDPPMCLKKRKQQKKNI